MYTTWIELPAKIYDISQHPRIPAACGQMGFLLGISGRFSGTWAPITTSDLTSRPADFSGGDCHHDWGMIRTGPTGQGPGAQGFKGLI